MYKRNVKPLLEFLNSTPPGRYYIDTQFAEVNFVSDQISANISTRIDACGDVYIIEIYDEDS